MSNSTRQCILFAICNFFEERTIFFMHAIINYYLEYEGHQLWNCEF